jgi:hypothetical protein
MTGQSTYGYPDLMRAGLANMLAPWMRCFLWCRDNDVQMLAPTWFKFRIGPYRRREPDKRRYHRLFTNAGYVHGFRRLALLATARRFEEGADLPTSGTRPVIVRFSGLGEFLRPAIGRSAEVAAELRRITRPEFLPPDRSEPFVAMHVRAGDFTATDEVKLRAGVFGMRLPVGWYVDIVALLRDVFPSVSIRVFSDGSPAELSPILAVPGIELVTGRSAITDLLDLSAAACLVASGSTFSSLAAFLGQVPSIWFPGQFRGSLMDGGDRGVEATWEPGDPIPDRIIEGAIARLP